MAVTYCTAVEVANLLNLTIAEGDPITEANKGQLVNPPVATIERYINQAEEYVDKRCYDRWRSTQIDDYEYHDFTHRDRRGGRGGSRHPVIDLKHDYVEAFSEGAGDKFELLTSNDTWTDLVATGTAATTPRDTSGDYFLNKTAGTVTLLGDLPVIGYDTIRTIYTYGGDKTVPSDVQDITMKFAAMKIIDYLPDTNIRTEMAGTVQYGKLVDRWEREIERQIAEINKQAFRPIYL